MNLVVLVIDFCLHSSIADLDTTENLEILGSVESLAALTNLVQHLVPSLDIVAEKVIDRALLDVPESLVRLPLIDVDLCLAENLLQSTVGLLNVELFAHFE